MFLDCHQKRKHQVRESSFIILSVTAAGFNLGAPVFSEDGEKPPSPLEGRYCECVGSYTYIPGKHRIN